MRRREPLKEDKSATILIERVNSEAAAEEMIHSVLQKVPHSKIVTHAELILRNHAEA